MVKCLLCRAIDLGFFCQISNPPPVFVAMMGEEIAVSPGLKPRPSLRVRRYSTQVAICC